MAILRIDGVRTATGHRSKTSIYNAINDGVFTKPVPIGKRVTGWPDYEVETLVAAQVAGQSKDEIRALVDYLHGQRAERFKLLLPSASTTPNITTSNVVQMGAK